MWRQWRTLVISAHGRLRQGDQEFAASLGRVMARLLYNKMASQENTNEQPKIKSFLKGRRITYIQFP